MIAYTLSLSQCNSDRIDRKYKIQAIAVLFLIASQIIALKSSQIKSDRLTQIEPIKKAIALKIFSS